MECAPIVRLEIVSTAEPLAITTVPSTVVSSRNCTVPVAVEGETVAVNFTDCPTAHGLALEFRVVVVLKNPDVVILKAIPAVAVSVPDVPAMVTGKVPGVAEALAVSVSTLVPVVGFVPN
jgi:hypothetical protein